MAISKKHLYENLDVAATKFAPSKRCPNVINEIWIFIEIIIDMITSTYLFISGYCLFYVGTYLVVTYLTYLPTNYNTQKIGPHITHKKQDDCKQQIRHHGRYTDLTWMKHKRPCAPVLQIMNP